MTLSARQRRIAAHYGFTREQAQILVDLNFSDLTQKDPRLQKLQQTGISNARYIHANGIIRADVQEYGADRKPKTLELSRQILPRHPLHQIVDAGFWGPVAPLEVENMTWMDETESEVIQAMRVEDGASISIRRGDRFFDAFASGTVARRPDDLEPTAEQEMEAKRMGVQIGMGVFVIGLASLGLPRAALGRWVSGNAIPKFAEDYIQSFPNGSDEQLSAIVQVHRSTTIARMDGLVLAAQQSQKASDEQIDAIFGI